MGRRAGVSHTTVGKRFGAAAPDMREMGRAYVEFAQQRPALFTVMFQPTVYRAGDPGVVAARARTTSMLHLGVGQSPDEATADVALGAWAFVHGIASLVLGGAIEGDAVQLYERAAGVLFRGGTPSV